MSEATAAIDPSWLLSWPSALAAGIIVYSGWRLLRGDPLLSSALPPYTGPYPVGLIDVELPTPPRIPHAAVFASTAQPAFAMETVLFALYYPASPAPVPRAPAHPWLPRPLAPIARGWARFAGIDSPLLTPLLTAILWALAGHTTIPAATAAPPLPNPSGRPWPVIVFSHGDASLRTSYSQYCAELASRGHVVAALEHRDGSAPATQIGGSKTPRLALRPGALLDPTTSEPLSRAATKEAQLAFRLAELTAAVSALTHLNDGTSPPNLRGDGHSALAALTGQLDVCNVTVAGHSFGATAALRAVAPDAAAAALPFRGCVALDPGKSSGRLGGGAAAAAAAAVLVVHSQSWSRTASVFFGRPHFETVRALVRDVNAAGERAWFMTCLGTSHASVTDAPLLQPLLLGWTTGATVDVREGLREHVRATVDFLRYQHEGGTVSGLLSRPVDEETYTNPLLGGQVGDGRFWQVHVTPEQGVQG